MNAAVKALLTLLLLTFSVSASTLAFTQDVKATCGNQAEFTAMLKNTLKTSQSYQVNAIDPSGWFTYYVTPTATAKAGESVPISFFTTPSPATPPGEYNFFITIESSSGETLTQTVWVRVNDCTKLRVTASGAQTACAGSAFPIVIDVVNQGADKSYGNIALDVPADFVGTTSFALNPGESRRVNAFVTMPANQSPGTVKITASASTIKGTTSSSTAVEVRDCTQTVQQLQVQQSGPLAGSLSGFFTASSSLPAIGIVIIALILAFIYVGRIKESERQPRAVGHVFHEIPQEFHAHQIILKPLVLPQVIKYKAGRLLDNRDWNKFVKRAKKIQGKVLKALGRAA